MGQFDVEEHLTRAGRLAEENRGRCTSFLRELMALPSPPGGERLACERVVREMENLGYDEIRIDEMGNVLGRMGSGSRCIAYDAHVDTVGISRPECWDFDPFLGKIEDEVLFGRGASDQKGGLATVVYGAFLAARLGLPEDFSLWVTATVNGEDCVGSSWKHIIETGELDPEAVVIAMPSDLGICRGQRGRMELMVSTEGVSSHGSHPEKGHNAITAMAPVVLAISRLHEELPGKRHPMLGPGSMAVTGIHSESPALTAIPDGCTIHVDRRLTIGEGIDEAVEQIRLLEEVKKSNARVEISSFRIRSWKGLEKEGRKVFSAWETTEDSDVFRAAARTARSVLGRPPTHQSSAFSSNACTISGIHRIPAIGFGPASEEFSHSASDQIPLAQLVPAMAFFAGLPGVYATTS